MYDDLVWGDQDFLALHLLPRGRSLRLHFRHKVPGGKPDFQALFRSWFQVFFFIGCGSEKVSQSCPSFRPHGLQSPWSPPGQKTGVGSLSLLQGIFPTREFNTGLPHCRWIIYQLSHQGSPRILEWVAYPFSGGFPNPGSELGSPAWQVDALPTELSEKPISATI